MSKNKCNQGYAVHPGEVLREHLSIHLRDLSPIQVIIPMSFSEVLNDIAAGKKDIDREISLILSAITRHTSELRMNMQLQHDKDKKRLEKK